MSVSLECKSGVNDIIYFIDNCCASFAFDEKCELDFDNSINFNIGDKVTFLEWYDVFFAIEKCNKMQCKSVTPFIVN
jgi:hypothetical protein